MRLESVASEVTGIAMLHQRRGVIITPDPAKQNTRFFLIEEASPRAMAAGYLPGDIVIPKKVNDIFCFGGVYYRSTFAIEEIIKRARDVSLDEFTDLGGKPIKDSLSESMISATVERLNGASGVEAAS